MNDPYEILEKLEAIADKHEIPYVDDIMAVTYPLVKDEPEEKQYEAYAKAAMAEYGHLLEPSSR